MTQSPDRTFGAIQWYLPAMPSPIIYAIGDIHGELELLVSVLQQIGDWHGSMGRNRATWIVTLGDYVDRGPRSAEVIELLMTDLSAFAEFERRIHLRGNHEAMMLDAVAGGVDDLERWLYNGGEQTLMSYGSETAADVDRVSQCHIRWLQGRPRYVVLGKFLFVHAGIVPGRPMHQQRDIDTLWIREVFLEDDRLHPWRVIHGHSYEKDYPVIRPNRIGLDTGAGYPGGRLTCVALDAEDPWGEPMATFSAQA